MLTRSMTKSELRAILDGKIPVYDVFEKTSHGYFDVILNRKHGLLNSRYEQILRPIYLNIEVVKEGIIVASKQKGVYEIFSETGNLITDRTFINREDAFKYASFF